MKKIAAIASTLVHKVIAAFTEEQRTALRKRVLPLFEWIVANKGLTYAYLSSKGKSGAVVNVPSAKFEVLRTVFWDLTTIHGLVSAVVDNKLTPAAKYRSIKTITKFLSNNEIDKLVTSAIAGAKACLKLKEWLNPEAVEFLQNFVKSPTTKLLAESWPYIVEEILKEGDDAVKDNGLMKVPSVVSTATRKAVFKRVQEVLLASGFKKGKVEVTNSKSLPKAELSFIKGDICILVESKEGVFPICIVDGYGYTNARTGVDSGWSTIPTYDKNQTIEGWIEGVISSTEERLKRIQYSSTQPVFKLAPGLSLRCDDARKAQIKQVLTTKGVWTHTPSGFGTGYTFRTKGKGDAASKELTDLVGKPVTFTTFDAD